MLKHKIKIKDFNDTEREVVLYFNLSKSEIVDIETEFPDGLEGELLKAVADNDMKKVLSFVKLVVHRGYGEKSSDGLHFRKNEDILNDFINSAMYSPLLMDLYSDGGKKLSDFISALMPADLVSQARQEIEGESSEEAPETKPSAREVFEERTKTEEDYRVPQTRSEAKTEERHPEKLSPEELEAFRKWTKAREADLASDLSSRPPHESGPGFFQN